MLNCRIKKIKVITSNWFWNFKRNSKYPSINIYHGFENQTGLASPTIDQWTSHSGPPLPPPPAPSSYRTKQLNGPFVFFSLKSQRVNPTYPFCLSFFTPKPKAHLFPTFLGPKPTLYLNLIMIPPFLPLFKGPPHSYWNLMWDWFKETIKGYPPTRLELQTWISGKT